MRFIKIIHFIITLYISNCFVAAQESSLLPNRKIDTIGFQKLHLDSVCFISILKNISEHEVLIKHNPLDSKSQFKNISLEKGFYLNVFYSEEIFQLSKPFAYFINDASFFVNFEIEKNFFYFIELNMIGNWTIKSKNIIQFELYTWNLNDEIHKIYLIQYNLKKRRICKLKLKSEQKTKNSIFFIN